jgi:hypothetical protein
MCYSRSAAFTLLEVVISITVFSFIMISVLGCWKCIVSGKMIAEEAARLPGDFPGSGLFGDNVMRRITFEVEKDSDGKQNLVMNQTPLLAVVDEQNTPYSITLARDVNVFMLEFWSVQDGEWEVSWLPTNQLPPMVRVTLGSGHSAKNPDVPYELICRTVAIPGATSH